MASRFPCGDRGPAEPCRDDGAGAQANVLALAVALGGVWAFGWHLVWQLRRLDTDDAPTACVCFAETAMPG